MNHCYRLMWNSVQNAYVPVPEHARGRGKSGKALSPAAIFAAVFLLATPAWAAPAGGVINSGKGAISASGTTTTIKQDSYKLVIDWNSFNVANNETVNFSQPNSNAIALNRVAGNQASEIFGKINANGQIFLLNPNGILFGSSAQVNVGGLVASTLDLSNDNFKIGNYQFNGRAGSVVNQGVINASTGSYVALLGGQVSNQGTLVAKLGNVSLAAGNDIQLDFAGDGLLSVKIQEGTLNALAENRKLVQVDGGQALLTAKAADQLIQAVVNNSGTIEARSIENSSGKIQLLGDMRNGVTYVSGKLDASAANGTGGTIETSAAKLQVADGTLATTKATNGQTGSWLIKAADLAVASSSTARDKRSISAATLVNSLANNNITLTADHSSGSGKGDLQINAPLSWDGNNLLTLNSSNNININAGLKWQASTPLTINAYNDIQINAPITSTGQSAALLLNYGNYAVSKSARTGTDYQVKAPVTLAGGNSSLAVKFRMILYHVAAGRSSRRAS